MTKRRHEVIQMSIAVTYETPTRSGARAARWRTSKARMDRVVKREMKSLAVGRVAGTTNDDHERAVIDTLGNMTVIT